MNETIFAPATAPGRAAVAVVRLSGPLARPALERLAGRAPPARRALVRTLRRPADGAVLDQALILWFPKPHSYTGEDCAELQLHGGPAVVEGVIAALIGFGLRLAEPGEFTRRAFEHGKLDLAQAEAVADLAEAETEAQRSQALDQLAGALSQRYAQWRARLIEILSVLEAAVDFPDEETPQGLAEEAGPLISALLGDLDAALADAARGERVREGFRVAVIGAPNAGKSSLLNRLTETEAAIVTAIPGTTRDVIEVPLNLGGFRVVVADTAGLRVADDPIEREGVRRARARADAAGLRLLVVDASAADEGWHEAAKAVQAGDLCVLNKADLGRGPAGDAARAWAQERGMETLGLSLADGRGLEPLRAWLTSRVTKLLSGAEFPAATQARHRRDLNTARAALGRARDVVARGGQAELAAEDVRLAARALARIAGKTDPEDVLDLVFARFCIGK